MNIKCIVSVGMFFCLGVFFRHANAMTGSLLGSNEEGNRSEYKSIHFYADVQPYKKGGVFFTFPREYFKQKPHITITIERNNNRYGDSTNFSCIVVDNSPAGAAVRVIRETAGYLKNSIDQASDEDVLVHCFAFGS